MLYDVNRSTSFTLKTKGKVKSALFESSGPKTICIWTLQWGHNPRPKASVEGSHLLHKIEKITDNFRAKICKNGTRGLRLYE